MKTTKIRYFYLTGVLLATLACTKVETATVEDTTGCNGCNNTVLGTYDVEATYVGYGKATKMHLFSLSVPVQNNIGAILIDICDSTKLKGMNLQKFSTDSQSPYYKMRIVLKETCPKIPGALYAYPFSNYADVISISKK